VLFCAAMYKLSVACVGNSLSSRLQTDDLGCVRNRCSGHVSSLSDPKNA
jgi:hypothetical protein